MSPVIRISDYNYEKLQRLATPFVDTPDNVIGRLVDAELARNGRPSVSAKTRPGVPADVLELSPETPDDLTHTRVRFAKFGERVLEKPNWNKLLRESHTVARKRLGSFAALRKVTDANLREGAYEYEGFSYVDEAGLSIQGADSNDSWRYSFQVARHLNLPIEVIFEWHNKDKAANPGRSGHLQWAPSKN